MVAPEGRRWSIAILMPVADTTAADSTGSWETMAVVIQIGHTILGWVFQVQQEKARCRQLLHVVLLMSFGRWTVPSEETFTRPSS